MNLSLERLPWDSEFFGVDVGRIVVPCDWAGHASELEALVRGSSVDLIYAFVSESLAEREEIHRVLGDLSGVLYDNRRVFRKRCVKPAVQSLRTSAGAATRISAPLEALAYVSGTYSRFAQDPRLVPFFQPMYRRWLEKELANGKVFVWPDAITPLGMATVGVQDGMGKIGLVAVAEEARGRGIALGLMAAVDDWLLAQGIDECEVVTQGRNLPAQALYRKAGFSCCDKTEVWHVWREDA